MISPLTPLIPAGDELPRVHGCLPGARGAALCDTLADVECPALTARRKRRAEQSGSPNDPIVWASARGANVVDVDGNVFVDLTAGFGAALVGHGHPAVVAAVQRQAGTLLHALGDVHPSEPKILLEQRIAALAPFPAARVILGLSGSDAVEAALKTCVLATGRAGVLAFEGGYHGLSHGPLAACGYKKAFREPFRGQLGAHVVFAPYPAEGSDVSAVLARTREVLATGTIGAVLLEPILGRGGVEPADVTAVNALIEAAHAHGALVIADEIYTGLKRTSQTWTYGAERWDRAPDVVCLGKALGGGMPVSACVMRAEVAAAWGDPVGEAIHTSTFLGNPLACAAAHATLDVLESRSGEAEIARASRALWKALEALPGDRGAGVLSLAGARLLAGVHLAGGVARSLAVVRALLERGYVTLPGGVAGDWITLTPPMALTDEQAAQFGVALRETLRAVPV